MNKLDILNLAFDEIGLSDYIYNLEPDQLATANKKIDAMVSAWSIAHQFPYPIGTEYNDPTDIQMNIVEIVYLNAAVRLAPSFGKQASTDTKNAAKRSLEHWIGRNGPKSRDDTKKYPNEITGLTL